MTEYNYVFSSLETEQIIAEIPLYGTYFTNKISGPGQGNGTFQLDQTGKRNQDLVDASIPGRTSVTVERNGVPIWTAIVWSRTYQSQVKACQLFFYGFEVFPARQRMLSDFTRTQHAVKTFLDLWTDMQASAPGRNLNVNVPSAPSLPTDNLTVTVKASERKYYGEIMHDLSDAKDKGFDWTIDVTRSGGQYIKTLRVGFPTLGGLLSPSTLTFEYPGCITNYYETESMASAATHLILLGSGDGDAQIASSTSLNDFITGGWPRWDLSISRPDIQSQAVLDGVAAQQQIIHRPPMNVIKATVKANKSPEFGSYSLGDACRLVINDPKHPTPLQLPTRLVGWELFPQSSEATEEATLMFAMELENV